MSATIKCINCSNPYFSISCFCIPPSVSVCRCALWPTPAHLLHTLSPQWHSSSLWLLNPHIKQIFFSVHAWMPWSSVFQNPHLKVGSGMASSLASSFVYSRNTASKLIMSVLILSNFSFIPAMSSFIWSQSSSLVLSRVSSL